MMISKTGWVSIWATCLYLPLQAFSISPKDSQAYDLAYQVAQRVTNQALVQTTKPLTFMQEHAQKPTTQGAFHVFDVPKIVERYHFWQQHLPNVTPFYAIKTNPDPVMMHVLGALGAGFDCASIEEIKKALSTGVSTDKVIFAHTRKSKQAITQASELGIKKMTFDSLEELKNIQALAPESHPILRIKTNDSHSLTPLSSKFGASMDEAKQLLEYAHAHKIHIHGISFHVGSNTTSVQGYLEALEDAKTLFEIAQQNDNMKMSILDLGGGWPGAHDDLFIEMSQAIQSWLKKNDLSHVSLIAEPGRYFSTPIMHAANQIIGKKILKGHNPKQIAYYLADGAYGLYMASLYYEYDPQRLRQEGWAFRPLFPTKNKTLYASTLWGPTCDSGDFISKDWPLPELHTGDYIYSDNVGAYTTAVQNNFNDMPHSKAFYLWTHG